MAEYDKRDAVPDGPQVKAETWFALAIAASIITFFVFAAIAIWIFTGDPRLVQPRAQAFTPFGAAMIALVTFFTVAWRGVLNTRQLDYQAAQLKHQADQLTQVIRQNDAKEEENLAKLLQEGAKLLGPGEKAANLLAGVTSLAILLNDKNKRFAAQAMDILADFALSASTNRELERAFTAANRALRQGENEGIFASFGNVMATSDDTTACEPIFGLSWVRYVGGSVYRWDFSDFAKVTNLRGFERTTFYKCKIDVVIPFKKCIFEQCDIDIFDGDALANNSFVNCDFSDARITDPYWRETFGFGEGSEGNYHFRGSAPISSHAFDWSELLREEENIPF